MTNATSKSRTISLTGRPPVKIHEDQWPVVADGTWCEHDGAVEPQANRRWMMHIRTRQHADGRTIVYGVYDYSSNFMNEPDFAARVGRVCGPDADLPQAITETGGELGARLNDACGDALDGLRHIAAVVAECIGELPAEEI